VSPATRRLRVGVIGTGMITQIMHLPYLAELEDLFEISALCDSSRQVLEHCGRRFAVDRLFGDWSDLLAEPLDAVLVLTSGSHAPAAVAAARAGIHVLVEKPMCLSATEGAEMLDAADRSGVVLMVGYPKRYSPAYRRAHAAVGQLEDLRFVRVTTLEAPFEPYVAHHRIVRGNDVSAEQIERWRAESEIRIDAAVGPERDEARATFQGVLIDTMVHEFNLLRGMLGEPSQVRFASLRRDAVTVVLDFGGVDCVVAWLDLPGVAGYEMEACFYDPDTRIRLSFPSPYLKNVPALLELTGGERGGAHSVRSREIVSYEEAFKLELVEFHPAVVPGVEPPTSGLDGLRDIALCESVVASARSGQSVADPTAAGLPPLARGPDSSLHRPSAGGVRVGDD
jgi:predicted dehydrogenase